MFEVFLTMILPPALIRGLSLVVLALLASAGPGRGDESRQPFRAGAHTVDITPTRYPVRVNAMFTERTGTNTVDPLMVRALALDDGTNRIVIAVVDTCMVPRDLIDRAKDAAKAATGLPTDRMLVSATHTHSAPSAMGCLGSRPDPAYAEFLIPRIAEAIAGAIGRLEPAQIGWGVIDDWEHTFNRRWIRRPDRLLTDPFGSTNVRAHMHPGHESPDVVGPSGPVDPALSVIGVKAADGRPLALLANYSQHYYGSPLLSSDYYGRFVRHVASRIGAGKSPGQGKTPFVAMMSQGTSGDLMWMDYSAPATDIGYDAYAQAVAERAASVWQGMHFLNWVPVRMAERELRLAYRVPDASRLAWARKVAAGLEDRLPATLPEVYALEALHLHEARSAQLKLQAIRIGDVGLTAIPNEVFALTGLKLKAQSPLTQTFNIELANGAEGYIPPVEQHSLGGYTTWPARTAGLEVKAEAEIAGVLLDLLEVVSGRPRRPIRASAGPYAEAVLNSRPAAYWRMEDASGPALFDSTPLNHPAVIEPGVALFLPGASGTVGFQPTRPEAPNSFSGETINRAIHLAGGRVIAQAPYLGSSYSVELWFWNGLPTDARGITGILFSRALGGNSPGDQFGIGGTNQAPGVGRLFFNMGIGKDSVSIGSTELGWRRWHHLVFVRSGEKVTLHLDGRAAPELEARGTPENLSDSSTLILGGGANRDIGFAGRLDEVAVYDRALTPEEIAAHYRVAGLPAR